MSHISQLITPIILVLLSFSYSNAQHNEVADESVNPFLGAWTLDIEEGKVGWLNIHDDQGYLDAEMMWEGGSVLPVGHIYLADDRTLVVTRTFAVNKTNKDGSTRKHISTYTLRLKKVGDHLLGSFLGPRWGGGGEIGASCFGSRMPAMPAAPKLSQIKYGKPIQLFNGKNMDGWSIIDANHKNGFKAVNGELVNEPIQPAEGEHVFYGNLRTTQEFNDFNLKLEVNVPEGNNSGVYLKGMYEVQVYDSYGKDLDSHHMGALYSRITPIVAAEKPGGSWQSLDITLCDRHVTVILNGKTIIDNQPVLGPTGGAIISDVLAPGPIYLQGDHGDVSYRNIVLTPIL